jgi:hypothetical protein
LRTGKTGRHFQADRNQLHAKTFPARLLLQVISFFLKRAIDRHLREMRTSGVAGHSTVMK